MSTPPRTPTDVDAILGGHVRALRVGRGLSQTELGQRIGVSFQQIQKYERGVNRVSASTLMLIATALGVSAAEILEVCDMEARAAVPSHMAMTPAELELLKSFRAISSRAQRETVLNLISVMAETGEA